MISSLVTHRNLWHSENGRPYVNGSRLPVVAQTLCLHGDTPGAPRIARAVRERLEREGVRISPLS